MKPLSSKIDMRQDKDTSIKVRKRQLSQTDGYWSLVVGIAAFLAQVILGGLVYTSGIYYIHFIEVFNTTSPIVLSWLCSMSFVGWLLGSSLGSMIINKFGYRVCAINGGLISGIGLCLCIFVNNVYLLFLFYGAFGCFGVGIYFIGFITAVNDYFDKYRSSAQVLMGVGSTIGMAVFSVLLPPLIKEYGWKGSLLLQGGISLNICALAIVIKPRLTDQIIPKKKRVLKCAIIFKIPYFIFCLNSMLVCLMSTVVFLYLPSLILSESFPEGTTSWTMLICALSNAVGSLMYALPFKMDALLTYTISIAVGGVMTLCLPVFKTQIGLYICTAVIGFSFTVMSGISVISISNLVPSKDFPDAIGINFIFRAVGAVLSGPVAGCLYDISLEYSTSFYVAGVCLIASSGLLLPVIGIRRCHKKDLDSDKNVVIKEEEVSLKPP